MATQQQTPQAPPQQPSSAVTTVNDLLQKFKSRIETAIPRHMSADRMIRVALTAMTQTPKLQWCDPLTICGAVVQASILGLEPNALLGEAFLVPYWNRKSNFVDRISKKKGYECQLQVGYKGQIKLARNSGEIAMVDAQLVHMDDDFDFEKGDTPWLKHKWAKTGRRGSFAKGGAADGWIGCWAGFKTKDGVFNFEYMSAEEIADHRDRFTKSRFKSDEGDEVITGPWIENPEWMWKKTPLIKVLKLAPKSVHVATAIALQEAADAGIPQRFSVDVPLELQPAQEDPEDHEPQQLPQRKSEATKQDAKPEEKQETAAKQPKPPTHIEDMKDWPDNPTELWYKIQGQLYYRDDDGGNYKKWEKV